MNDETAMPFEEGAAACPFVAFDDDRDHRSDVADSRHRCYAAAEPEARDTSHQERFCLSVAFAACPIFLEWARAEAAGVAAGRAAVPSIGQRPAFPSAAEIARKRELPAFLSRGRTTPAEAAPVTAHAADPGSGLWGFEGAPRRTVAPVVPPSVPASSYETGLPPMARRQPTKPDWENPPRYDNFPRLRARDDRSNNQPLLLAALGVAVLMVALILVPLIAPKGGGATGPTLKSSGSQLVVVVTPTPTPAQPERTFMLYQVRSGESLNSIAAKFGISFAQIMAANPEIKNPNYIQKGQYIKIPWQTWVPPASPTPTDTPTPLITPYH